MSIQTPTNFNHLWASLIVEELIRTGVDYFCLAPGSRCTPLTVAIAENNKAKKSIHFDERGLAFHALGYGRATGRPAVVVTTSGTAVPNTMPAVVEASMERVPMLLLTADRPPELRDSGSNQTIDQTKIFGDYARWFVDMPCPDPQVPPEMVLTTIDQAVYRTGNAPAGPVHMNCMFREPLAPEPQEYNFSDYLESVSKWIAGHSPYTRYAVPECSCDAKTTKTVAGLLEKTRQGLVVVGGVQEASDRAAITHFLKTLQWPVCADITSGLRIGDDTGLVMAYSDILARASSFTKANCPDTILHLGGRVVSKHLAAYVAKSKPSDYVLIADHPQRQDPGHEVTMRIEGDLSVICSELAKQLGKRQVSPWLALWQKKMAAANHVFEQFIAQGEDLNEPVVAFLISQNIPSGHGLFLASSMPVRDMDLFAYIKGPKVPVGTNRGASGVDGTIASAAGFAKGLQRPTTLFMGDLAFLHDLNSLNYLRNSDHPVVVVVINNNGGGIFSFLPIARFEAFFDPYFVSPHGLHFEQAARMFELPYYHPKTRQEFLAAYGDAAKSHRSAILEVTLDRKENYLQHTQLISDIQKAFKE